MRFEGKVFRDGRFWLAEIPLLEAMTQGRTRAEALVMIADWLETMVDHADFRAEVHPLMASLNLKFPAATYRPGRDFVIRESTS
jgi:predicted RNase H-like HicB family nuclease